MKYVYIAGPYTAPNYFAIERNINAAAEVAAFLAESGVGFFCPHLHSAHFEVITPDVPPVYWYDLDIHFMEKCDAIYLLPGWQRSVGTLREKALMEEWGRPVFESLYVLKEWLDGR